MPSPPGPRGGLAHPQIPPHIMLDAASLSTVNHGRSRSIAPSMLAVLTLLTGCHSSTAPSASSTSTK